MSILLMRDMPAPTIPLKSSQRRRPLTVTTEHMTPRRATEPELAWSPRAYISAFQQGVNVDAAESARSRRHRSMVSTASSASGEQSDAQREHEMSRRAYLQNKMARRQQRLDALDRLQPPSPGRSNSSSEEPDYAQQTMASLRRQLQTSTWSNDGVDDDSEERLSSDADSYEGRSPQRLVRRAPDNSSSILAWNEHVKRERAGQYRPASANYTYL